MARIRGPRIGVLCLVVVAAGLSFLAVTPVEATTFATKKTCSATASGAAWKYSGQHGTKYKIVAVNGSASLCSTAAKWMNRLSHNRATFQLKVAPPGWRCSAIGDHSGLAKMGECQYKRAIIEWKPATK
jgi:hypothetical protein